MLDASFGAWRSESMSESSRTRHSFGSSHHPYRRHTLTKFDHYLFQFGGLFIFAITIILAIFVSPYLWLLLIVLIPYYASWFALIEKEHRLAFMEESVDEMNRARGGIGNIPSRRKPTYATEEITTAVTSITTPPPSPADESSNQPISLLRSKSLPIKTQIMAQAQATPQEKEVKTRNNKKSSLSSLVPPPLPQRQPSTTPVKTMTVSRIERTSPSSATLASPSETTSSPRTTSTLPPPSSPPPDDDVSIV